MSPSNRLPTLQRTIARLTHRRERLDTLSRKYWRARRAIFLIGSVLALLAWYSAGGRVGLVLALALAFLFAVVAFYHNRVRESLRRHGLLRYGYSILRG